jgi:hypothetical protein
MAEDFPVVLSAGSLRADSAQDWQVPHAWSDGGVVIEAPPNGAGVLVLARGEFDADTWQSTGVTYALEVDSAADADEVASLVARVDEVAEVPRALRAGMTVQRR